MPINLAWIDGRWGGADDLQLPLSDRGLQLADGLFETVLVLDGAPQLLPEHLARWVASAELLGMNKPPSQQDLSGLIDEAIVKSELHKAPGKGAALAYPTSTTIVFGSHSRLAARVSSPSKRSQVDWNAAIATA